MEEPARYLLYDLRILRILCPKTTNTTPDGFVQFKSLQIHRTQGILSPKKKLIKEHDTVWLKNQ